MHINSLLFPESKAKFRKLGHCLPQHNVIKGGQDSQTTQSEIFNLLIQTHEKRTGVNVPLLNDGAVICDP